MPQAITTSPKPAEIKAASTAAVVVAATQQANPMLQSEKDLAKTLKGVLRGARKEDSKVESDTGSVAKDVLTYLTERANAGGKVTVTLSMAEIKQHCYDLAEYDRTVKTAISPAFEMRVDRACSRALAGFQSFPSARADGTEEQQAQWTINQYDLNDKGQAMLPSNVLAPTVKVDTQGGGKAEIKNPDATPIAVPDATVRVHLAQSGVRPSTKRGTKTSTGKGAETAADFSKLTNTVVFTETLKRAREMNQHRIRFDNNETLQELVANLYLELDKLTAGDADVLEDAPRAVAV